MKKIIIILCLSLITLGCCFAGRTNIVMQVSPFSFQQVSSKDGKYSSVYGYGANTGIRCNIWKNLSIGTDLAIYNYDFDELKTDYLVVSGRLVAEYDFYLTENLFVQDEIGIEVSTRAIGYEEHVNFGLHGYLGFGYRLSHELSLVAGCTLDSGFQKGKTTKSSDVEIQPGLGFSMVI